MSNRAENDERVKAYIRRLENPYAKLSFSDDPTEAPSNKTSLETNRALYREMQNPYAYDYYFGEPEEVAGIQDSAKQASVQSDLQIGVVSSEGKFSLADIESELDETLRFYKPYVARDEWGRIIDYKATFLEEAKRVSSNSARIVNRLREFRFPLLPGEKIEHNRAPAARIIGELKRLLG